MAESDATTAEAPMVLHRGLLIDAYIANELPYTTPNLSADLLSQMQLLRQEKFLTDVVVCVEDQTFHCHKLLLVAASPYFKAWFQHDEAALCGDEIVIGALTASGFGSLLEYIYTATLEITSDNILDVLDAADFLQFREIAELCCRLLLQHITSENSLSLQQVGEGHLYPSLAQASVEHSLAHFSDVVKSRDFLCMPYSTIQFFLGNQKLHVKSEIELLRSIIKWVEFDAERKQHFDALLDHFDAIVIDQFMQEMQAPVVSDRTITRLASKIESLGFQREGNELGGTLSRRTQPVMVVFPTSCDFQSKKPNKNVAYYYDFEGNRWHTLTHCPFHDRSFFSVTEVENDIIVVGGEEMDTPVKDACKYFVNTDTWEVITPMLQARSNHAAAAVAGKLYTVGGAGPTASQLRRDGEVLDPQTGQWTMLPCMLDVEGVGNCALVPLDGKLYIFGGTQSYFNRQTGDVRKKQYQEVQYFDMEMETWHRANSFTHHISTKFQLSISVASGDALPYHGCILIFDENLRGRKIRLFDPATEKMVDFIHTHGHHKFGGYVIFDEALYCSGGLSQQLIANDMVHCVSLREQPTKEDWKMLASLPSGISHHAAFVVYKKLSDKDGRHGYR